MLGSRYGTGLECGSAKLGSKQTIPGGVRYPYRIRYFFAQQLRSVTAELFFFALNQWRCDTADRFGSKRELSKNEN
jgi:hypothetical protein